MNVKFVNKCVYFKNIAYCLSISSLKTLLYFCCL